MRIVTTAVVGLKKKIIFLAPIYTVFSPTDVFSNTDVEVLWFNSSWQLSRTQLLAPSSSIPKGVGGPLLLLPAWGRQD